MSEVTKLPALPNGRPETGPMQFGDDWPGIFIRGDNALHYAMVLRQVIETMSKTEGPWWYRAVLEGLASDLASCSVGDTGWPPFLKPPTDVS
jgi:hypothetical protein